MNAIHCSIAIEKTRCDFTSPDSGWPCTPQARRALREHPIGGVETPTGRGRPECACNPRSGRSFCDFESHEDYLESP